MNHPDFRLRGKVFASLGYPDADSGMVKVTPDQQRRLIQRSPLVFRPANGAWGRGGSTIVHLASARTALLREALAAAARNVSSPPKAKGA